MPSMAAMVPPPWPTAKPVTSAITTMMRSSLAASRRKAEVAGSSTRMKTSSCVRYDCRTSSGVGRIRDRTGWRRDGPASRLVTPEAREELRTTVDDVRDEMADVAEERTDRVGCATRVAVDEDNDEGDHQVDQPLLQIDLHCHRFLPRSRRLLGLRLSGTLPLWGDRGQPAHPWTATSFCSLFHRSGRTEVLASNTGSLYP